jgi:hypothetical protein
VRELFPPTITLDARNPARLFDNCIGYSFHRLRIRSRNDVLERQGVGDHLPAAATRFNFLSSLLKQGPSSAEKTLFQTDLL